jgi:hypothetical protein
MGTSRRLVARIEKMSGSSSLSAESRGARVFGRFAPALYVLGVLITGFGFLMLIPLAISWLTADGAHGAYDEAVLITILSGLLLSFFDRPAATRDAGARELSAGRPDLGDCCPLSARCPCICTSTN